jgi:hypothetical protein
MVRVADRLIAWLMRPRIRRVRRWSFLVTVPVAFVVGHPSGRATAVLRDGPMYRVQLPLSAITGVTARTERMRARAPHSEPCLGLLATLDLAGLGRDALQPG